jgi:hypothetical protein
MANTTGKKFGGRSKGTPNKTTAQIRNEFQLLISNNIETLQKDIDLLEPKDRIKTIIEFSKFILPTLRGVEVNEIENNKPIFKGFSFLPTQIITGEDQDKEFSIKQLVKNE